MIFFSLMKHNAIPKSQTTLGHEEDLGLTVGTVLIDKPNTVDLICPKLVTSHRPIWVRPICFNALLLMLHRSLSLC